MIFKIDVDCGRQNKTPIKQPGDRNDNNNHHAIISSDLRMPSNQDSGEIMASSDFDGTQANMIQGSDHIKGRNTQRLFHELTATKQT